MDVAAVAAVVDVVDDVIVVADDDTIPPPPPLPLYVDVGVTVLEEGRYRKWQQTIIRYFLGWNMML